MSLQQVISLIGQKKKIIFWLTVLGAVLAFDLMVIQTPHYKATSRVLVIQKQIFGQNIYSISKASQYLSQILKEGIYSDSFFEKVVDSSYGVSSSDFPDEVKERREKWAKTVKVSILRDLGVLEIKVFHPEKEKAVQINQAVTGVLTEDHWFYHGGGQTVQVNILDYPLVSKKPVTLWLWLGTLFGGLIGFLIGVFISLRKHLKFFKKDKKESVSSQEGQSFGSPANLNQPQSSQPF